MTPDDPRPFCFQWHKMISHAESSRILINRSSRWCALLFGSIVCFYCEAHKSFRNLRSPAIMSFKMQHAFESTRFSISIGRRQQRPIRRYYRTVAAAVASPPAGAYSNPIGVHALVFAGDWTEASATAAAAGAKAAGYDLVSWRLLYGGAAAHSLYLQALPSSSVGACRARKLSQASTHHCQQA